jgi:FtsP/CotA-like multicopper oxidase with cupredoxin domain
MDGYCLINGKAFPAQIVSTDGFPVPPAEALTKDAINIGAGEGYEVLMRPRCHLVQYPALEGVRGQR